VRSLENYANNYPASSRAVEAKYYRAESFYRMKDYDKSLNGFYEISDLKTFELINRITARIAELEYKKGRYEKAIPFYNRLAQVATNKKEQYNAWAGLMDSHFQLGQYDSSQYYAQIILEKGNVNAGAESRASLFIGKAAMAKGDYETAKDEFVTTMNTARDEYGAEAKYRLGEIFYLTKDYKQCYETLISLPADFSTYDEWVGRAFLLLADNFMAEGKNFQAKATLNSLKDFPLAEVRDQAMNKLKQIEKAELSMKVPQDTTDN
jgi:TolA-binding protein